MLEVYCLVFLFGLLLESFHRCKDTDLLNQSREFGYFQAYNIHKKQSI